jgi:hypothetical protein
MYLLTEQGSWRPERSLHTHLIEKRKNQNNHPKLLRTTKLPEKTVRQIRQAEESFKAAFFKVEQQKTVFPSGSACWFLNSKASETALAHLKDSQK